MVGGGLTIGGWFAGAVIANFVGKARSILEERHELQGDVAKMLLNVQGSLLHIRAAIDVAERRLVVDGAFTDWLQMIKGIASDAEDLLDDFETKRIKASQQNKVSEVEPVFLGREEEEDKLMSIIFPDAAQTDHLGASRMQEVTMGTASVRTVCIVGEAGVGKTALAQVIYNHPNVKEAFDLRGWVFLSERSDLNEFFKKIVRSFAAEQHPFDSDMGLEALQASSEQNLSSIIQNKRFFLVLDNAKDNLQREWRTLSAKLTGGAAGSIVLVTTRSAVLPESKVITLHAMPIDTVSTILEHHALGDNRKDCLKSIAKEIASKMHGLPLSAEVIGRLLRTKLDEKQWQNISRSEWWDNYEDKAITNHALPSLTIALEFLSAHLKECLGYCSIFPSSYLFDKNKLAHMWMCDSMQQHHESVSETREIQWFDELCSRCLVQPTVLKNKYIVNETIKYILASTTQTGCYTVEDSRRPRTNLCGFSYIAINKGDFNVSLGLREHTKVRSILIFDGQRTTRLNTALDAMLPHRSSMRVLDLSCIETNMERPPDVIITYSHLRYLDLSFTGITVFPESFCGLHHLQVLGMRGCRFNEMPRDMNKLVNLRYLYTEVCTLSLIHSIGQLTNLQCLEEFAVNGMDGHRITELKNLNYLGGHLCISNLDKVTCIEEVSDTELSRKMYIQKLVLKWQPESASSDNCMQTLSHLKPSGNIEDLEIQFYMGVLFPEWIANHCHFTMLRYIKFSGCKKLARLPPLGKLSHLKILILQHLEQIQSIGDEFYGGYDRVFPSLEELTFCGMINWQTWLDIKTPQIIPHIRKIVIKNCRRLSDLPKSVLKGSLKELELSDCKEIFRKSPCCLEYLETLKRLKVHNCLGITINIPRKLLASIEVLNLQNCKVCFEGGQEHVHSLRRYLTIDCDEEQNN
uniref:NB-ARC domain-containing protein n=1 Tax=Oryza glumipatula TaxID=40148 RepID=A0A0E0AKN8_9ORYZ